MPVGLDGNPDPIVTEARVAVLDRTVRHVITRAKGRQRVCVAVDGRSGAGKSTFADEMVPGLRRAGFETLRSTTDSFHRPRSERMRLGSTSSEGYFLDSHQLDVLVEELLDPFRTGREQVLVAAFDEPSDAPHRQTATLGNRPTVLVFDGLFVHRPELVGFWDASIYLSADERLDRRWLDHLLTDLPEEPSRQAAALDDRLRTARWPRYRDGWFNYATTVDPAAISSISIDNNDLSHPRVMRES